MYKLVILDVDGTLITDRRRITKPTKRILKAVIDKGVHVAICTGRNKRMTHKILHKIEHPMIYSCVNGTEIYNENHEYIHESNLRMDMVKDIIMHLKDLDCCLQVTTQDGYHKYVASEEARKYDIFGDKSIKTKIVASYLGLHTIKNLTEFFEPKFNRANEVVVAGDDKVLDYVREFINEKFPELHARDDMWPNYLFIGKQNNRKTDSMKHICNYYNIDTSEVIAIGNDYNDIDMVRDAGLGIAVENSIPELISIANDITYSNQKNGVAKALEHYILKGNMTPIKEMI